MSKQVGSAHIAIFPVMRGFRKKTAREFDAAANDGRSRFLKAFGRTGEEAGGQVSRGFRKAFGRTDLASPGLKRLKADVASASAALSKARLAQQDAAGKVTAAEARLQAAQTASANAAKGLARAEANAQAARKKFGENSAQAQAAESKLETARNRAASTAARVTATETQLAAAKRRSAAATDAVTAAAKRLASAQSALGTFTAATTSKFATFGRRTADAFKAGFTGALGPSGSIFEGIAKSAGRHLQSIARAVAPIATTFTAPFKTAASTIGGAFSTTIARITSPFRTVASTIATAVAPIASAFTPIGHAAATAAKTVTGHLSSAFHHLGTGAVNAGRTIASTIGGAFKAVGGAALAAAGIVASAFSSAIGSAVSRVDTLNNYPKIMKNLGYSTDDAENSIKKLSANIQGLPTALNDIASTTQMLAPLTGSLDQATELSIALNNAFLAGGKGAGDAARGLQQFTQMLATGKVDMMSWRTLQETMPAQLSQVAQELLGVGAKSTDLYTALQNGTISFEDFNAAIVKLNREGTGEFASFEQQAKDATSGIATAFQNVRTALAKGGAKIIEAIGPENITAVAGKMQAAIGAIADKVAGLITKIKDTPGLAQLAEKFSSIAGIAAGALAPLLSKLPLVGRLFSGLTGPIGIAIGLIAGVFNESQALRDVFGTLVETVGGKLTGAFDQLGPLLESAGTSFTNLLKVVGDSLAPVIEALIPVISEVITIVTNAATLLLPMLTPLLETVGTAISGIADVVTTYVIPAIETLLPVFQTTLETIATIVGPLISTILEIITTVMAVLSGDWEAAWAGIKGVLSGIWETMQATVSGAIDIISSAVSAGLDLISSVWTPAWEGIKSFASTTWDSISSATSSAMETVRGAVSDKLETVKTAWSNGWTTVKTTLSDAWTSIKKGVSEGITSVVTTVSELPGKAKAALGDIGNFLYESGKSLITGFKNGITSAFTTVRNAVSSGLSKIRNLFPFSPAKEGPFSGRGWVKYSGESIPPAMAAGIRSRIPVAAAAARDLAAATSKAINFNGAVTTNTDTAATHGPTTGSGGGVVFNIGAINNPQSEPSSTTLSRELARVAAGVTTLV